MEPSFLRSPIPWRGLGSGFDLREGWMKWDFSVDCNGWEQEDSLLILWVVHRGGSSKSRKWTVLAIADFDSDLRWQPAGEELIGSSWVFWRNSWWCLESSVLPRFLQGFGRLNPHTELVGLSLLLVSVVVDWIKFLSWARLLALRVRPSFCISKIGTVQGSS